MNDNPIQFEMENAEEAWKRVAKVTVSPEHMESLRGKVVEDLRKQVNRPGFRKGKVPVKIIRTEYAGDVEREAIERVVPEVYQAVLQANEDIHPIADPRIADLDLQEGQPLGFKLEIEVRPDFELKGLGDLSVEKIELIIDDDRVADAMKELAERNAKWVPIERGAQDGDALMIEYVPIGDDGEAIEGERTKNYAMELGGEGVLPEFNSALQGLETGEDTTVEVSYPEDYPREELQGKQMNFQVTVEEIKEKQIPEQDDDFAQSVSPYQSLSELQDAVRDDLANSARREAERQFHEALVDEVLKVTTVPVPPSLEARYVQAMVKDLQHQSGREFDEETMEKLRESYGPAARRATQRWLLLDHIRRTQEIEVGDEEVRVKFEEIAEERGATPEQVEKAFEAGGNMDHMKMELSDNRAFDWLAEQVEVKVIEKKSGDDVVAEDSAAGEAGDEAENEAENG